MDGASTRCVDAWACFCSNVAFPKMKLKIFQKHDEVSVLRHRA